MDTDHTNHTNQVIQLLVLKFVFGGRLIIERVLPEEVNCTRIPTINRSVGWVEPTNVRNIQSSTILSTVIVSATLTREHT